MKRAANLTQFTRAWTLLLGGLPLLGACPALPQELDEDPAPVVADAGADAEKPKDPTCLDCPAADGAVPVPPSPTALTSDGGACGDGFFSAASGDGSTLCPCSVGATRRCYGGDRAHAGIGVCRFGIQTCESVEAFELSQTRWGPCIDPGSKAESETCEDELDNDCDGEVDEGCPCKEGATLRCTTQCGGGTRLCQGGFLSECSARKPAAESCNGIDDDCDGVVDGITQACENGCGSGVQTCTAGAWSACSAKAPSTETCNGIDDNCDGVVDAITRACSSTCGGGSQLCTNGSWSTCSAKTPTTEICNGVDDDCNGSVDNLSKACSTACGTGTSTCSAGSWSSCSARTPSSESCNLLDDDCDGVVDDGLTAPWSFRNLCSSSSVFVVFGTCNVCNSSCTGTWVAPGSTFVRQFAQNSCVQFSAFVRTPTRDICLDLDENGGYVGQTRQICNGNCIADEFTMRVQTGC